MTSKRVRSKKASSKASSSKRPAQGPGSEQKSGSPAVRKSANKASKKKPAGSVDDAGSRPDDMPEDVLEFITAIDTYKRAQGRPFPTWSEILDVLKALGYRKAV